MMHNPSGPRKGFPVTSSTLMSLIGYAKGRSLKWSRLRPLCQSYLTCYYFLPLRHKILRSTRIERWAFNHNSVPKNFRNMLGESKAGKRNQVWVCFLQFVSFLVLYDIQKYIIWWGYSIKHRVLCTRPGLYLTLKVSSMISLMQFKLLGKPHFLRGRFRVN